MDWLWVLQRIQSGEGECTEEESQQEARAEVASPTHEAGRIRLPADAPWGGNWIDEHANFPVGAHDHQVDETSQLLIYLAT